MVVSIAANERGTGFICGHDDGSIIRYYISEDSGSQISGRIIQHQTTPIALAWANGYIIAAGCDRRILIYDSQVSYLYFNNEVQKEGMVVAINRSVTKSEFYRNEKNCFFIV